MSAMPIISAVHQMLVIALTLVTPFLAAAVLTSFAVGLIQATTRINDLTLSFIPRFCSRAAGNLSLCAVGGQDVDGVHRAFRRRDAGNPRLT